MRGPSRRGFCFVELVVVVVTIGLMVALLLPAVMAVREASRRCECINHLHQLGLALKQYETTHRRFPAGSTGPAGPVVSAAPMAHVSWTVELLPYIDQAPIAYAFNASFRVDLPENATVRSHQIGALLCPSDGLALTERPPMSSYAGCHHDSEAPIDVTNNGYFRLNRPVRYEDVLDGSSQTIALGERLAEPKFDQGWAAGDRSTLRNPGPGINFRGAWARPGPPTSPLFVGSFQSYHPGGANFAFGDGAVRFLKTTMTIVPLTRLANVADGEVLSSDEY